MKAKRRPLSGMKRPPAAKRLRPLEVEASFNGRSSEGAGHVAGEATQVLSPRSVSGRDLNASKGTLNGWGLSPLVPISGLSLNVYGTRIQLGNNTAGLNMFSRSGLKRRRNASSMSLLKGCSLSSFTLHLALQKNCNLVSKLGQSRMVRSGGAIEMSKISKSLSQGHNFEESSRAEIPLCSKFDDEGGATTSWEKENLKDSKRYVTVVSPSPSSF